MHLLSFAFSSHHVPFKLGTGGEDVFFPVSCHVSGLLMISAALKKDAHGQNRILAVKERVEMSPLSHIPGNSEAIL